jgi:hypothetical protein
MSSCITEWVDCVGFVDEQTDGPFRRFHHEHLFFEASRGGTTMIDTITFDAPYGVIGPIVEKWSLVPPRANHRLAEQQAGVALHAAHTRAVDEIEAVHHLCLGNHFHPATLVVTSVSDPYSGVGAGPIDVARRGRRVRLCHHPSHQRRRAASALVPGTDRRAWESTRAGHF